MTAAMLKRVFVLLLLFCAGGLFAIDLDDLGYDVIRSRPDGDLTLYEVRDSAGNELVVVYRGELSAGQGERLDRIVDQFFSFEYITLDELRVVFAEDRTEILAVPASFTYDGVQLARYMPAGMTFYFDNALEYDFRIRVENIFVRISGQLFDEQQFADRIARAVENPVAYMQTQDPQFIFQRFTELEERLSEQERDSAARREALQGEIDQLERRYERTAAELDDLEGDYNDLSRSHRNLQRSHENLAVAHSALRDDHQSLLSAHEALRADYQALLLDHQELQVAHDELETEFDDTVEVATREFSQLRDEHDALALSHGELQQRHQALREEHDALGAEHLALLEQHQGLREEFDLLAADTTDLTGQFERLRFASVTAHNTGFLGIRFPVPDPTVVAQIIELKATSPGLDVDGVFDALREQEVDVERKLVQVVFEFYFNDYGLDEEE